MRPGRSRICTMQVCRSHYAFKVCMSVMLSPFNKIRPSCFLVFFFIETSSASSSTKFIYSSKPMIFPSIRVSGCSNSQMDILCRLCRNRKIKLIGCVIIRWTRPDMVADDLVKEKLLE
ncbi:hypothetical protein BSKO_08963 [Bryopsis sp. KO-2023]|nr:hypothetical protein BSKO_08963 [Bryopsis sp. KO-2023]